MNISSKITRRFVRLGVLGCIIPLLIACGSGSTTNPTATSTTTPATGTSNKTPVITGTITEFPVGSNPSGITAGLDHNLWFTEGNNIGRMTTTGTITEFPVPTSTFSINSDPKGITAGPDGNLWFTEYYGNKIGRITPTGTITAFPIPTTANDPNGVNVGPANGAITAGPDGNLWFTGGLVNNEKIGRMTPTGSVTEFPVPTTYSHNPNDITAGRDGNLWFADPLGEQIGRMTPTGSVTEFPVPTTYSHPGAITAGPDGNLWFTEPDGGRIGRITPTGSVTEFPVPNGPGAITTGPDGNLWFTEAYNIGRMTPTGSVTEFPVPTSNSEPEAITAGPDGNLWFTETNASQIGRITSGNQQTPAQTSAPGDPVNVNNVNDLVTYNGTVDVTWYPSEPNGAIIDHYDVVEIHSNNTIGATVASVPASGSLSWKQTGLNLCTYYRYGVKAVTATGEESSVAFPLHQAFTSGSLAPGYEPKTVVVMAMGVRSQITGGTMHLLSRQSYCTTYDGISPAASAPAPLQSLLDGWDNQKNDRTHAIDATGPNGFGAGNRMIDSLVSRGAIVLPMSYSKGTRLTGPSAAPTFTTAGYKPDDVGNTRPDQVAQWLDDELVSIHTTWPNAKIIVVGHSAGGLATYLWWTRHGQYQPQGVVQAFSLDGPINGTQNSFCTHNVTNPLCNFFAHIGSPLAQKVADLWNQQDQLDHDAQKIEQKSPIFTAVGTQGDAVWDFADGNRCAQLGTQCVDYPGGDNNGLVSQVFHGDTCKQWDYTASAPACAPAAHSIVSKCGPLDDGTHDFYGLTGTEWTHSNVKNCPDVIAKIVAYAYHPTSKPTANENPLGKVDWTKVVTETDLGCNGPTGPHLGVEVDEKQFADVTGDGKKEAFVAVACVASTSSWPDRLEVFDGASDPAHPRRIATLLDYQDGTDELGLRMGSNFGIPQSITVTGRTVTVVSHGYAPTDGLCCPSWQITDTFTWNGSGFTRGPRSVVQAKAP